MAKGKMENKKENKKARNESRAGTEVPCRLPGGGSPYRPVIDQYIKVARLQRAVLERLLCRTGVYRSQHRLLMFIAENPRVSQKELARMYQVTTATVAVSLKKLESGGYIRRSVNQEDNRFNQICITEKGRRVAESSVELFRRTEERMFAGFTDEEIACLSGFLERLCRNLEDFLPETGDGEMPPEGAGDGERIGEKEGRPE